MPEFTEVLPVYVFAPVRLIEPVPFLVRLPVGVLLLMMPVIVPLLVLFRVRFTPLIVPELLLLMVGAFSATVNVPALLLMLLLTSIFVSAVKFKVATLFTVLLNAPLTKIRPPVPDQAGLGVKDVEPDPVV